MILYRSNFSDENSINDYIKNGKGDIFIQDGKLYLDDSEEGTGLTVWNSTVFDEPNIKISFDAYVCEPELASNVNFFFMAKETDKSPQDILKFSGSYNEYHQNADMYIVTLTGEFNLNGSCNIGYSRFRKDPGFNLLSETYDIKAKVNCRFHFEIIKKHQNIDIFINDRLIHSYKDENPYNYGLIGFRTWKTKLWYNNLIVEKI